MPLRIISSAFFLSLSVFFFIQHLDKNAEESEIDRIEDAVASIERISADLKVLAIDLDEYGRKEELLSMSLSDLKKSVSDISATAKINNDVINSLAKGQNKLFSRISEFQLEDFDRDSQLVRQAYISLLVDIEDAIDKSKLNDYELERFGVLKDPNAVLGIGGNEE